MNETRHEAFRDAYMSKEAESGSILGRATDSITGPIGDALRSAGRGIGKGIDWAGEQLGAAGEGIADFAGGAVDKSKELMDVITKHVKANPKKYIDVASGVGGAGLGGLIGGHMGGTKGALAGAGLGGTAGFLTSDALTARSDDLLRQRLEEYNEGLKGYEDVINSQEFQDQSVGHNLNQENVKSMMDALNRLKGPMKDEMGELSRWGSWSPDKNLMDIVKGHLATYKPPQD